VEPGEWLVSRFGLVEVSAGLCRAGREGRLPPAALAAVTVALAAGALAPLQVLEVSCEVYSLAVSLLSRHPLRAGDAMHLAAALTAGADRFICSDNRLLAAAEAEGLTCLNPVAHATEDETAI